VNGVNSNIINPYGSFFASYFLVKQTVSRYNMGI